MELVDGDEGIECKAVGGARGGEGSGVFCDGFELDDGADGDGGEGGAEGAAIAEGIAGILAGGAFVDGGGVEEVLAAVGGDDAGAEGGFVLVPGGPGGADGGPIVLILFGADVEDTVTGVSGAALGVEGEAGVHAE